MWQWAALEAVQQDTADGDHVGGEERRIVDGEEDSQCFGTANIDEGNQNRDKQRENNRIERNIECQTILQRLAMSETGQGVCTGAKIRENGTPRLRAKDQSCLDAAARPAMAPAVWQITTTAAMTDVPAWLLVAL